MKIASRKRETATVRRLHPARVLVAGSDQRFRSVISFLLARRGLDVLPPGRLQEAPERASRDRVDVVVLDAFGSLEHARQAASAISGMCPRARVLIAVEGHPLGRRLGEAQMVRRWCSIDELAEGIQDELGERRSGQALAGATGPLPLHEIHRLHI